MKKCLAIGIILLFVGTCIIPAIAQDAEKTLPTSRGNWLYVGGSGPGNYTWIQDAINSASEGSTVFVYDDSSPYYENIYIYKDISIIGENKNSTIIDGENRLYAVEIQNDFGEPDRFSLSNFTIKNGNYGIRIISSGAFSVVNNILIDNKALAINIEDSDEIFITNNIITDNSGGIFLRNSDNNLFSQNRFENNGDYNEPWYISGIDLLDSYNNTITDNFIIHNHGNGISSYSQQDIKSNNIIQNNTISYNYHDGISLSHFSSNSRISGNNISYNGDIGIYLWNNNNITISNNVLIKNNQSGIYIWEDVNHLNISNNCIIGTNQEIGTGLVMRYSSNNTIFKNIIMDYNCGFYLLGVTDSDITYNTIQNNSQMYGMYLSWSQNNIITHNNFIGNKKTNIYFEVPLFAYRNHWDYNYWGSMKYFPKIILGWAIISDFSIPWCNVDWHPAQEPYDIPGTT